MRNALWPHCTEQEHRAEMAALIVQPERFAQFIVRSAESEALGFAEASLRFDYVNGTESSPVAFLEGLYVVPGVRRNGIARLLVRAVAAWAAARGCTELASNTPQANASNQVVHRKLGFEETERVVCFNLRIGSQTAA